MFGIARQRAVAHSGFLPLDFARHNVPHSGLLVHGSFGAEMAWGCAWLLTKRCGPNLDLFIPVSSPFSCEPKIVSMSHTLYQCPKDFAPRLQERVSHHDLQEALQPFPSMLDHIVGESVCEHLAG